MIELRPEAVSIGQSADPMERIALRLMGTPRNDGVRPDGVGRPYVYNLPHVCEHSTLPLPHGCWTYGDRSPYARYGAELWCDACIAYAALNGTLPKPEITIDLSTAPRIAGAA